MEDLAVKDDAAADAGAEGQEDEVVDLFAGAHPGLAEGGGVGVVLEDDGGAEAAFDIVADGEILQIREVI